MSGPSPSSHPLNPGPYYDYVALCSGSKAAIPALPQRSISDSKITIPNLQTTPIPRHREECSVGSIGGMPNKAETDTPKSVATQVRQPKHNKEARQEGAITPISLEELRDADDNDQTAFLHLLQAALAQIQTEVRTDPTGVTRPLNHQLSLMIKFFQSEDLMHECAIRFSPFFLPILPFRQKPLVPLPFLHILDHFSSLYHSLPLPRSLNQLNTHANRHPISPCGQFPLVHLVTTTITPFLSHWTRHINGSPCLPSFATPFLPFRKKKKRENHPPFHSPPQHTMNRTRSSSAQQNDNMATRSDTSRTATTLNSPLLAPLRRSKSFSLPSHDDGVQSRRSSPTAEQDSSPFSELISSQRGPDPGPEGDSDSDDSTKTTIFDSKSTPAPSRSVSPIASQHPISELATPCSGEPLSPSTTPRSSPPPELRAYLADMMSAPHSGSAPGPRHVTFSNIISKLSPPTEKDYSDNEDEASLPLSQKPLLSFQDRPKIEFSAFGELLSFEDEEPKSKSTIVPPVQRGQKRSLSAIKSLEEQMEDVHLHLTKARRLVFNTPGNKKDSGVSKAYRHLQSEAAYLSQEIVWHRYYSFYNHLQYPTPPTKNLREIDEDMGYLPSQRDLA